MKPPSYSRWRIWSLFRSVRARQTGGPRQAAASLSHHGPVAETFIGDRVPYAAAMTDRRTAIEITPKGPVAVETAALWKT
jgi:hypothetical protein